MNKNNTPALYAGAFGDAHELTDAELSQVQGAGGSRHNAHNCHHSNHRSACGYRGDQSFYQGNYAGYFLQGAGNNPCFQGAGNDQRFRGDCDDLRFRPNCYSQEFQVEHARWNNC